MIIHSLSHSFDVESYVRLLPKFRDIEIGRRQSETQSII